MIAQSKGPTMGQKITRALVVTDAQADQGNDTSQVALKLLLTNSAGDNLLDQLVKALSQNTPIVVAGLIGTAAKTSVSAAPPVNTIVHLKFTSGNSAAAPTVAFDGGAAKPVLLGGAAPIAGEIAIGANGIAQFFYDGTSLHQIGVYT
jgi:hypothetical protein